jgi:N4-gp56 family major capsid protein
MNTLGTIPPAIQAYYDRNLLERAVPADIHGRFGQVRPIKMRSGNQIKFRRFESLSPATTPLTEGATSGGTTRAGLNSVISTIALRTAIRALDRQNAKFCREMITATTGYGTNPIRAAYIGLVHGDTLAELEQLTGFTPIDRYSAAMKAEEDEVGAYRNIRFFKSTNCKVWPNAGLAIGADGMISTGGVNNDVYATLIVAANSYGVVPLAGQAMQNIIKPLGSAGSADPLNQRATSGWKAVTTTKILNDAWMLRIEHCNRATLV